jgi:hypothetical protein
MAHLSSDPRDFKAADAFCGLIEAAAAVFTYRLTLGGSYTYTYNHGEILELMQKLTKIIEPYEKQKIDI